MKILVRIFELTVMCDENFQFVVLKHIKQIYHFRYILYFEEKRKTKCKLYVDLTIRINYRSCSEI
jgi:hypothetical protein